MNCEGVSPVSPKQRGVRVRHIRETLLRYTREKFSKKHGIPAASLQNWEIGKYGGLTEKAARKLVSAFAREGILCSVEWLLYAIGTEPGSAVGIPVIANAGSEPVIAANPIIQELQLFHRLNPGAVDALIIDDSMSPLFYSGDLVAGVRYFDDMIPQLIGGVCIAQLTSGETLVRRLDAGTKPDYYTLSCLNPETKIVKTSIQTATVFSVAPILWLRRPAPALTREGGE